MKVSSYFCVKKFTGKTKNPLGFLFLFFLVSSPSFRFLCSFSFPFRHSPLGYSTFSFLFFSSFLPLVGAWEGSDRYCTPSPQESCGDVWCGLYHEAMEALNVFCHVHDPTMFNIVSAQPFCVRKSIYCCSFLWNIVSVFVALCSVQRFSFPFSSCYCFFLGGGYLIFFS